MENGEHKLNDDPKRLKKKEQDQNCTLSPIPNPTENQKQIPNSLATLTPLLQSVVFLEPNQSQPSSSLLHH